MSGTEQLKPLKFAAASRTNAAIAAKEEREAATVRYDDEKAIQSGDRLRLVDKYGPAFGEATVTETETMPAGDAYAYILSRDALYPASSFDQMMGDLNDHYGGVIHRGTDVKVIIFQPDLESFVRYVDAATEHGGGSE